MVQVGLEEGPLSPIEILSLEYELETESNAESVLSAYQLSLPTLPPLTPLLLSLLPPYITMSQYDYPIIIRQLQEQVEALTAQLVGRTGGEERSNIKVTKLQVFDRTISKISGFVLACKLFIRIRLRETLVEEQIQWVLSYMQEGLVDV